MPTLLPVDDSSAVQESLPIQLQPHSPAQSKAVSVSLILWRPAVVLLPWSHPGLLLPNWELYFTPILAFLAAHENSSSWGFLPRCGQSGSCHCVWSPPLAATQGWEADGLPSLLTDLSHAHCSSLAAHRLLDLNIMVCFSSLQWGVGFWWDQLLWWMSRSRNISIRDSGRQVFSARSVFRLHQQSSALEIHSTFKALFGRFFHFWEEVLWISCMILVSLIPVCDWLQQLILKEFSLIPNLYWWVICTEFAAAFFLLLEFELTGCVLCAGWWFLWHISFLLLAGPKFIPLSLWSEQHQAEFPVTFTFI